MCVDVVFCFVCLYFCVCFVLFVVCWEGEGYVLFVWMLCFALVVVVLYFYLYGGTPLFQLCVLIDVIAVVLRTCAF